jgi:hypothetical protein
MVSAMAILTGEHVYAFGSLTYQYAIAESGIRICLAGLLKADLDDMLVLTDSYSAVALRNVAKVIAKTHIKDERERDRFVELVGRLKAHGPLRNHIAHSRWKPGKRPGSIKVLGIDIRSGSLKVLGHQDDEQDWLASEIMDDAAKLMKLNRDIVAYMEDTGIRDFIEDQMDDTSSVTASDHGISTKPSE